MSLWGVSCPTVKACVAVGTSGRVGTNQARPLILVSADGGVSWGQRQAAPTGSLAAVACWSTTGCVVTGSLDATQWTDDGGATWSKPRAEQASDFLTSLSCLAPGDCVALGMSGVSTSLIGSELPVAEDHLVERTQDGGRTWQHKYVNGPDWPWPLVAISCPSSTRCVGVGGYGTIKASGDGGVTWARQGTGPLRDIYAITCPSPTTCYAVGDGVAASSTDSGKTWVPLPVGGIASTVLKGIACTSTTTCLIVGGRQHRADGRRRQDMGDRGRAFVGTYGRHRLSHLQRVRRGRRRRGQPTGGHSHEHERGHDSGAGACQVCPMSSSPLPAIPPPSA